MKKINNTIKLIVLLVAGVTAFSTAGAQPVKNMYLNVDWQLNLPIRTGFADRFGGWGMNIDHGYYITDNIGLGLFVAFHTNHEYIGRQTISLDETAAITTDQQHSLFQLPFGVAARYSFTPHERCQPYVALKMGANYSKMSTHMNIFKMSDNAWGFHISPEIGTNLYLDAKKSLALHLATYYSYSTNKSDVLVYSFNGINNWGIRIGLGF